MKQETYTPIDGTLYVSRDYASGGETANALSAANTAGAMWGQTPINQRAEICHRMVDKFVANREEIAEEITRQMGRPIRFAGGEVDGFAERARYMIDIAEQALSAIDLPEKSGLKRHIEKVPLGLVLVVAPWNYPYLTAVNAVVPAIMAGNTVILKHSAQTPLCAERMYEAFASADLPSGVFQFLHLQHTDVEKLIRSGEVNHLCFTGSVQGGRAVETAAAGGFIGTGLELGGKDPAYVRADANLDHAVAAVIDGAFFNSGQSCCGIERAYVHRDIYDDFVEKAAALTREYLLGNPMDPDTTLGPMVRTSAADFVRGQVREAIAQGAKPLIEESGFAKSREGTPYLAPQLLIDVDHGMRVMTEESFGPVLGIQKVGGDEEAVRLMNDSDFGLTAAIFSTDQQAAEQIGNQLETGTVFLNRCDYLDPALPWTGVKQSGRGCTLSALGYDQLTRPKSFHFRTEP